MKTLRISKTLRVWIIPLALAIDLLFGEPPNRLHPVAWMGNLIAWLKGFRPYGTPRTELAYGAGLVLSGATLVAAVGWVVTRLISGLPTLLRLLAEAVLLKMTFSLRGLHRAAGEVQNALQAGDLPEARRRLSWHLVSRDTSELDESQVSAATIESVAENASDGILAPLAYYTLGGLPLALAYRFTNTADAMLGYHTPELEWLGKFPARLDDLLNLIPARLTGWTFVLVAPLAGGNSRRAAHILRRDARLTESPNAGYPMSAMSGALGVELEKTGHYHLGSGGRRPFTSDIPRARRLLLAACTLGAALFSLSAWVYKVRTHDA